MTDQKMTRREFHEASAGVAAAGILAAAAGPFIGRVQGANKRLALGIIGCGGMGLANMQHFIRTGEVDVVAVCDVDRTRLDQAVVEAGGKPTKYTDFRELLQHTPLDAVVIATPDHWHALPCVEAIKAGKDVYVEKPLSLSIAEGRVMVDAARKHGRIVQMGTLQRSGDHFREAVELVSTGYIGFVSAAQCFNYANTFPNGIGNPPDEEPPANLDWDFWLGPRPRVPYNRNRCHYNFRWFWDYSGGMMTDWGTHLIDIVHWAMGVDAPSSVASFGGKYCLRDNRETPDTQEVIYQYPKFVLTYSYREVNRDMSQERGYGIRFHGTKGTLLVDRGGFRVFPERDACKPLARSASNDMLLDHVRNFLQCVNDRTRPRSDVEIGHRSTSAAHLGNIALRTGNRIEWDALRERIRDFEDRAAQALLSRRYREPWRFPRA